nr:hypothetical protein [Oligoflexales bacterium]
LVDDSGIAEYIAEEGDCSSTSYSAYGGGGSIALNLSAGSALKTVCLKVRDAAGNVSSIETDSIQLDQVEPNSTIDALGVSGYFGPNTTVGANTTFSGAATDNLSGLDEIFVSVQEGAGLCLNLAKTAFSETCPEWILATGTATWSFSIADAEFTEGETYTVRSKAIDVATVEETSFPTLAVQWLAAAPSAEFTVNSDDAATSSASVNLVLDDDTGISEYFAEVGACGTPVFVAYLGGGNIAFNLTAGQGIKTVCLIVRDSVGNTSAIDTDAITFDSVDPSVSITIGQNIDADTTAGVNTSFAGTASDVAGSGLDSVEVQIKRFSDGSCLNTAKSAFNETCPHYVAATGTDNWSLDVADALFGDGKYEVTARATDIAQNENSASQIQFWFSEDNQMRFIDVAIGEKHACGLGINGLAYCWGQNTNGQLGVDAATEVAINAYAYKPQYAVNVPASEKFIALTAGSLHSCGLNQDGKIFCWGSNSHGQIGNNGVGVGNDQETALQISLGEAPSAYYLQVKAAGQHSCALHINGKVYCWGRGDSGEIGDGGTTLNNTSPVETNLPGGELFINLAVGQYQNCAMSNNSQKFYCWGRDSDGEVGDGTPDDGNNILEDPIAVDLSVSPNSKMIQAAGSRYATCSLSAAGQIFCFGNDAQGAVGDGAGDSGVVKSAVAVVPETAGKRFSEISAGLDHFCALSSDAKIWCWGDNSKNQGGKDVGTEADVFQPKLGDDQTNLLFKKVASGGLTSCGIAHNGSLYCFGSDDFGQRGDAGIADAASESPVAVDVSSLATSSAFVQMASGRSHLCALSGAGHVYCWGSDDSGQIGNGSSQDGDQDTPMMVEANMSNAGAAVRFRSIAAAGDYSCALATNNKAYCWGDNTYGQLGNGLSGSGQKAEYPVAVGGNLEFRSLAPGLYHVCGLRADEGSIYCWGKGDTGAIGDGNDTLRTAPTLVSGGYTYIDLAAGNGFSCGVRDNLDAYCWGSDYYRALGDGDSDTSGNDPSNVVTTAASGFLNISAKNNHICGLTADHTVECWGRGNRGQLGNNQQTIKSESTVTTYAGNGVRSLSAGEEHTCLSAVDGRLHCFGSSDNYVSNGVQSSDVVNPFDFYGFDVNIVNAKQASSGQGNTCFINGQGQIRCIGRDTSGEKGDGSNLDPGEFDALDLTGQLWY